MNFNVNGKLNFNSISQQARQVIFNLVYPVGSYFITESSNFDTVEKVQAHFGGTWAKIIDRVLYGVSSDAGTNAGLNEQLVPVPLHNHTASFQGYVATGEIGPFPLGDGGSSFTHDGVFDSGYEVDTPNNYNGIYGRAKFKYQVAIFNYRPDGSVTVNSYGEHQC